MIGMDMNHSRYEIHVLGGLNTSPTCRWKDRDLINYEKIGNLETTIPRWNRVGFAGEQFAP